MHRFQEHPYTVEITSRAWKKAGNLPENFFRQLKGMLEGVAAWAGTESAMLELSRASPVRLNHCVEVQDRIAVFSISPESRMVTLLDIMEREQD